MDNGTHLILDIRTKQESYYKLCDTGIIEKYLTNIVDIIEMTEIIPAKAFSFPFASEHIRFVEECNRVGLKHEIINRANEQIQLKKTKESGVTGYVILAESHSTCHTYPEKNECYVDIFSCKSFETKEVIDFTIAYFDAVGIEVLNVERCTNKPQIVQQCTIVKE